MTAKTANELSRINCNKLHEAVLSQRVINTENVIKEITSTIQSRVEKGQFYCTSTNFSFLASFDYNLPRVRDHFTKLGYKFTVIANKKLEIAWG